MFAVLHITDFALHAVLRLASDAAASPAALLDDTSRKAVVLVCNDAARAEGVDTGQTAAQALAHCGQLLLLTRRPAAEAEAQAAFLAAAFAVSPKVEATAPGTCTMDVRGLDAIRRRTLLHAAVQRLERSGLPTAAGLAATPLLALYAARRGQRSDRRPCLSVPLSTSPTAGRDACRYADTPVAGVGDPGPRGGQTYACNSPGQRSGQSRTLQDDSRATVIVVDEPAALLAPLPLAVADPEPELAEILNTWGVHTLGQLTALPKAEVAHRLGPRGLALWERAAGETTRVLRLVSPPKQFIATMEFEHEEETLEPLLFILRRFVDRLALELEAAHLAAMKMICKLKLVDGTACVRDFRLPEPTQKAETLFHVLHTHLEQLRTESPIVAVGLRLKAGRSPVRQRGLFDTELNDPHGFAETLARVEALLPGRGESRTVGAPYVADSHRPDAVIMEAPPTVVPPAQPPAATWPPLGLPLRRFRPPLAARVELEGGRPVAVWSQRVQGLIAAGRGPWLGAGDWWEARQAWEREEWDVEMEGGGLYRLVRTPEGWLVEGEYD